MVFLHFKRIFESLDNQSCGQLCSKKNKNKQPRNSPTGLNSVTLLSTFSRDEPLPAQTCKRLANCRKQNNHDNKGTTHNKATNHLNCRLYSEMRQQQAALAALIRMTIIQRPPTPSISYYSLAYIVHKFM